MKREKLQTNHPQLWVQIAKRDPLIAKKVALRDHLAVVDVRQLTTKEDFRRKVGSF